MNQSLVVNIVQKAIEAELAQYSTLQDDINAAKSAAEEFAKKLLDRLAGTGNS